MANRTSKEWLRDLSKDSPNFKNAIEDLRLLLKKSLKASFSKLNKLRREDIEDVIEECVTKILQNLNSYSGKSHFTTWCCKISVNTALNELRHKRWKNVSLEDLVQTGEKTGNPIFKINSVYNPERQTIRKMLMDTINKLIQNNLTEQQRKAMLAVRFYGMPLEEAARQIGTNRNNLYKILHDARLKLKKAMINEGITKNELFETFMD